MKIIVLIVFLVASIVLNIILCVENNKVDREYDKAVQCVVDAYNKHIQYEYAIWCLEWDVINSTAYRDFYQELTDRIPVEQFSRKKEVKSIIDAAIESYDAAIESYNDR